MEYYWWKGDKTGIAVFLTVLVCEFFNIPTIFAVITAIVTIEPTATDSIKRTSSFSSFNTDRRMQ